MAYKTITSESWMHNFRTQISLLHCIRSGVFLLPQRIGERQSLLFPACVVKDIYSATWKVLKDVIISTLRRFFNIARMESWFPEQIILTKRSFTCYLHSIFNTRFSARFYICLNITIKNGDILFQAIISKLVEHQRLKLTIIKWYRKKSGKLPET